MTLIYKLIGAEAWREAEAAGVLRLDGSAADLADGFIHFSSSDQLAETAAKHFKGQGDLVLITVDAGRLGAALRWEPSRDGALFPHLYDALDLAAVVGVAEAPLDADGLPAASVETA